MKRLLVMGLIPMMFMVLTSGCESEAEKHEKAIVKLQNSINKAVAEEDFVTAHQYLGDLLLLQPCPGPTYNEEERRNKLQSRQETSIRDVYLAEIRCLVAKNDEFSWNRAYMLPMEVPHGFETVQKDLYKVLFDYAMAFDNEEIEQNTKKTLSYLKGDRIIMPVSTSISGPMGEFFELVDKEDGYKLIVDEETEGWRWLMVVIGMTNIIL